MLMLLLMLLYVGRHGVVLGFVLKLEFVQRFSFVWDGMSGISWKVVEGILDVNYCKHDMLLAGPQSYAKPTSE